MCYGRLRRSALPITEIWSGSAAIFNIGFERLSIKMEDNLTDDE